jgi:hypothetical protein
MAYIDANIEKFLKSQNVKQNKLFVNFICLNVKITLHLKIIFKLNSMKTNFLFPNSWKTTGWVMFILPILTALYYWIKDDASLYETFEVTTFAIYSDEIFTKSGFFNTISNPILDEILLIICLIGGLLVGFSKTKNEDEMIAHLRYTSLVWATYFNIIFMIIATLFVFGMVYFNVMIFFMISSILFFVIRFHFMIYKLNKYNQDDK